MLNRTFRGNQFFWKLSNILLFLDLEQKICDVLEKKLSTWLRKLLSRVMRNTLRKKSQRKIMFPNYFWFWVLEWNCFGFLTEFFWAWLSSLLPVCPEVYLKSLDFLKDVTFFYAFDIRSNLHLNCAQEVFEGFFWKKIVIHQFRYLIEKFSDPWQKCFGSDVQLNPKSQQSHS